MCKKHFTDQDAQALAAALQDTEGFKALGQELLLPIKGLLAEPLTGAASIEAAVDEECMQLLDALAAEDADLAADFERDEARSVARVLSIKAQNPQEYIDNEYAVIDKWLKTKYPKWTPSQ